MALVYKAGCRDFMFDGAMDAVRSMDENPDIHHVFPKDWCNGHGVPKDRRDSIVNKTPLLPETNRSIGGDAPSVYKETIKEKAKIDEEELRARVESHLVDWNAFSRDDFQAHFVARARRLLDLVEEAMGKEVADRDSEQTRKEFGASLAKDAPAPSAGAGEPAEDGMPAGGGA